MSEIREDAKERLPSVTEAVRWARNEARSPNFVDGNPARARRKVLQVLVAELDAAEAENKRLREAAVEAKSALDAAGGLVEDLFRQGTADTEPNEYGRYFIGEGFLPMIVAARDGLAAALTLPDRIEAAE